MRISAFGRPQRRSLDRRNISGVICEYIVTETVGGDEEIWIKYG